MSALSKVRIWARWTAADPEHVPPIAQDYDHQTLSFAAALPTLATVAQELADRRGLTHRVVPPAPDNRAYVTGLVVTFPSRKLDLLNNDDATTRRHLAAWLEYYAVEQDQEFVVYTQHTAYPRALPGEDPPAAPGTVTVSRCYRGHLLRMPPEVLGLLNGAGGGMPAYLALEFNVTDQGTFASWDAVDLTTGWDGR
jgi:hypothetical protein